MKKQSVISSMARARYAVNIINGTASQTNQIPQSLALELANKIEEGSSIMVFEEKSVDFGTIHLLDSNMETIAHIWVLKYPLFQFIGVKQKFRAQLKLQHLLDGYEKRDYMLPVDLVFYIRNDTGFLLRIGDEQFTCGYYCLEIDIRLANGKIFTVRRREGVWYRNFINEEDVCGEKIHRRLVSLNPRLWTGLPSEVRGDKVYLRPRFAFFSFVNAGRHYKSTSDLRAGRELKSWNGSREGELVGDWLIISADRFRSWARSDLREGNRRSVP